MPTVHLRSASSIDPDAPVTLALAAMARVPMWLASYTSGRPAWGYAVGDTARLLWPALGERKIGIVNGPAARLYRGAMEARWARCVERGDLSPDRWAWAPHGAEGPLSLVPDGAVLVCTCRPDQECHLDWFGPWLARAGWAVVGRGGEIVEAG